jgi:hypothetical protein
MFFSIYYYAATLWRDLTTSNTSKNKQHKLQITYVHTKNPLVTREANKNKTTRGSIRTYNPHRVFKKKISRNERSISKTLHTSCNWKMGHYSVFNELSN